MQSLLYVVGRSSSDGGGGGLHFLQPSRKSFAPALGIWAHPADGRGRRSVTTAAAAAFGGGDGEQDHYAVLGIRRAATGAEVKKAYRLLARKYHPDVSRGMQTGEIFKSIRLAYEVLSDEVTRAQYDMTLNLPKVNTSSERRNWTQDPDYYRRIHRWAELRKRMGYKRQYNNETSWYYDQTDSPQETSRYKRDSFAEVLRFAFFILFFMQMVGYRALLALCGVAALFDQQLDAGYKVGYLMAWLFGGQGGFMLAMCIYFASWLCGKKSSSVVALVVVAMWVGAIVARFAPIPQGAMLTLLYMSIKLQVDSK